MQNELLKDKVIIVTGAFGGIGLAIAKACLNAGAKVLLHGRSERNLTNAMSYLDGGVHVEPFVGDVTGEYFAKDLMDKTISHFGQINGIVNNAAYVVSSNIHDTDLALFR